MTEPRFKTAYGPRHRVPMDFEGVSLTQQCFKDECDVNRIVEKYQKTGLIDHVNTHQGQYADLGDGITFEAAMDHILKAEEAFTSLPSFIRKRFSNDPREFLEFVNDPDNGDELVRMGLAKAKPPVEPVVEMPPMAPKKAFKAPSEELPAE
jgi:phage internal scaffolding protein